MNELHTPRRLSKSRLIDFRQCEKRLWLQVHRQDLRTDDPDARMRMAIGNEVGVLARSLYDPKGVGVLFDAQRDGYSQVFESTRMALTNGRPLFEAGFAVGTLFAFTDLLLPERSEQGGVRWRLIEVKSAASVKEYHLDDLAVQVHILDQAGVPLARASIACVDSSWTYPGSSDYRGLLREKELLVEVRRRSPEVKHWADCAQLIVQQESTPDIKTGQYCHAPLPCPFFDHCSREMGPSPSVAGPIEWLPRVQTNALRTRLSDPEVLSMEQVEDELLNDLQRRVKTATMTGKPFADSIAARDAVTKVQWPLYFLDFESVNLTIPRWGGTRPFEQVPFQYSLHILHQDGHLDHREFIDLSGKDPRRTLAEQLTSDIAEDGGTVLAYNSAFEIRVMKRLAEGFEDLSLALMGIIGRTLDLLPIARATWYHPDQRGSWSIKAVLPTIGDRRGSYGDLQDVADGQQAIRAYMRALSVEDGGSDRDSIRTALLKYCAQDTYAMVLLWRHIEFIAAGMRPPSAEDSTD